MNKRKKLQWHAPFTAATKLALRKDKDLFVFEEDYPLGSKPLEMDLLIIKKVADAEPENVIAKLFRTNNILEYKSPGDTLNIDTWFKTIAYASLYKSLGSHTDERKAEKITVTLIREKKPVRLFAVLQDKYDIEIREAYPGVYYLTGKTLFPTQFIETGRLDREMNNWLRCLTRDVTTDLVDVFVAQSSELRTQGEIAYSDSILDLMLYTNKALFYKRQKENKDMTPGLARFYLEDEIKEYKAEIASLDAALADREAALADKDAAIADRDAALADKDAALAKITKENARLKAKLAARKR